MGEPGGGEGVGWVVLSDGARPTEDIYFLSSAAPLLEARGHRVWRLGASRRSLVGRVQRLHHAGLLERRRLLLCRSLPEPWVAWLERHRGRLGPVYYLIDDDIGAAAVDATLPSAYRQRMGRIARLQPRLLALADVVVASSGQLAERLSHSNVQVLTPPLLAPLPALDHQVPGPSSSAPWRIGFYGTRAHLADLAHIGPALAALQNGRDDTRLEIMLGEYTPQALAALPRTHTPAPMAWPAFQAYQRRQRVHIGLAPLWPTAFNAGKSFIKFLDIAAMGGVGVYSHRYPYTEVVRHGENGLLVDDCPDQWQAAITWLLENPAHAARMAQQAAADARRIGHPERAAEFWRNL